MTFLQLMLYINRISIVYLTLTSNPTIHISYPAVLARFEITAKSSCYSCLPTSVLSATSFVLVVCPRLCYNEITATSFVTVVCPRLNPFAADPIVITSLNQYELRLSTYDRVPGTIVTLSCVDDLEVQGQSVISCQENGYWNFESRPFCASMSLVEQHLN
jgi:hypothetical protein